MLAIRLRVWNLRHAFLSKILRLGMIRSWRAWRNVVAAHAEKDELLDLARRLLMTEEGVRFVETSTLVDPETNFDDCFEALAASGDVGAMLTCIDLFETIGASDETRDYLSWFWPAIKKGGLTNSSEAMLVLRNICRYASPDHGEHTSEMHEYAIELLMEGETSRPELLRASLAQLDRLLAAVLADERMGDERTISVVQSILSSEARLAERRRSG